MSGKRQRRILLVAGGSAALVAVAAAPLNPRLGYDPEALHDPCLAPDYAGLACFALTASAHEGLRPSASAALLPGESREPSAAPAREPIRLRYETAGLAELDVGLSYGEPSGRAGRYEQDMTDAAADEFQQGPSD